MRSDARGFHDGPEHELQFEAGYIGARPNTASSLISLATHGWSIHWCQHPTFDHTAAADVSLPSKDPKRTASLQVTGPISSSTVAAFNREKVL